VRGHVDEHGAVPVAPAPGEVVNAEYGRGRRGWLWQGPDESQQVHPAHTQPEVAGQSGSGAPAQREGHRFQHPAGQQGIAAVAYRQPFDLLSEDLPYTLDAGSEEPPDPQVEHRFPTRDRGV
jgi:hypothetical protein